MGNYTSSFLKEKGNLNQFSANSVPSFNIISKEIIEKRENIGENYLDQLFERCCFLKLNDFFDKYSEKKSSNQCKSELYEFVLDGNTSKAGWFFYCKECSIDAKEESCICLDCFLSNDYHIENNHSFNLVMYPSATCDCGNTNILKPEGFCKKHCKSSPNGVFDNYNTLPLFLKKDLHIFFRYLLSHFTTSTTSLTATKKFKQLNNNIIDWLVEITGKSTVIKKIFSEELIGKVLFDKKTPENNGKSVADVYQFQDKELSQCQTVHGFFLEFFMKNLISYEFSTSFIPILEIVLENEEVKKEFLNIFFKHYSKIFKSEDKYSNAFLKKTNVFFQGFHHLTEQFALRDKDNLMEVILTSYLEFFKQKKRVFPRFTQLDFNIDISFWFSYVFTNDVVQFIMEKKPEIIGIYTDILFQMQSYSTEVSCDFKDLGPLFVATFEDVIIVQFQLIISKIKEITINDQERELRYMKIILDEIVKKIEKIPKEPLYEKKGSTYLLPRMDNGETMTCEDIVIFCSLYRLLGSVLMVNPEMYIPLIKPKLTKDLVVNMVDDLFVFLCVYLSYESDPFPTKNIYVDLGVFMAFIFTLQLGHTILGTEYFLFTLFNSLGSLVSYQSNAYERPFRIIISVLDKNLNFQIDDEDLKYHLSNWIMSKTFSTWHEIQELLHHSYPVFYKSSIGYDGLIARAKRVMKECIVNDNFSKLNPEMLCYFDSYYPFYTQADKTLLFSAAFEEYSLTTNSVQVSPPPISNKLLPVPMRDFYNIFTEQYLYEIMHLSLLFQYYKDQEFKLIEKTQVCELFEKMVGCSDYLAKETIYMTNIALYKHKLLLNHNKIENYSQVVENIKKYFGTINNDIQKYNNDNDSVQTISEIEETLKLLFPNDTSIIYNLIKPKKIKFNSKSNQVSYKFISLLDLVYNVSTCTFIKNEDILYEYYKQMDIILETLKLVDESLEIYINSKSNQNNGNNDSENDKGDKNQLNDTVSSNNNKKSNHEFYNNDINELKITYPNFYQISNYDLLNDSYYHNIDSQCCSVCKEGNSEDPLLLISHINFSAITEQTIEQNLKDFIFSAQQNNNPRNTDFLEKFFKRELGSKVEYLPDRFDYFQLYCIYLFNRTYSTSVKSCGHKIHSKCFSTSIYDKHDFNCPDCKSKSNVIIPITSEDGAKDHTQEIYNEFYLSITKLYFLPFVSDVNFTILERFLWKAVLKNIEMLEMKSRLCQLYKLGNDNDKDGYYIYRSNDEFVHHLKVSKILYDTIQKCKVNYSPSEPLPIKDPIIFLADVFTTASYSHYITKSNSPLEYTKQAIELELFKMMTHHIITSTTEIKTSKKDLTLQVLKPHFEHLTKHPLPQTLVNQFNDQIYPLLRKFYILEILGGTNNINSNIDNIKLENLSNFDLITQHFQFNLEDCIKSLDYIPILHDFLNVTETPSGLQVYGIYPLPIGYKALPKFIELPNTHYEFIKTYVKDKCIRCKKIQMETCLICGVRICLDPECIISLGNHWFQCPTTNINYFVQLNSPALRVMQKNVSIATNKTHIIYCDPSRNTLEDSIYNQYVPLSKNLTLDKNNLKELYIQYYH